MKYSTDVCRYVQLRGSGGGTRQMRFNGTATHDKIIEFAKSKFFKNGRHVNLGRKSLYRFCLGNFSGKPIPTKLELNDEEVEFTLHTYAQVACLTRYRFYLLMKKVTDVIREMGPIFGNSEEYFSIPKVKQPIVGEESSIYSIHESELTDLHHSSGIFQSSVSSSSHTSTLLGTNRE